MKEKGEVTNSIMTEFFLGIFHGNTKYKSLQFNMMHGLDWKMCRKKEIPESASIYSHTLGSTSAQMMSFRLILSIPYQRKKKVKMNKPRVCFPTKITTQTNKEKKEAASQLSTSGFLTCLHWSTHAHKQTYYCR